MRRDDVRAIFPTAGVAQLWWAWLVVVVLAGCAHTVPPLEVACTPVEVVKPVPVRAVPAAELLAPLALPDIEWTEPTDGTASSCVTTAGEQRLLDLVDGCVTRVQAWRAWGVEPVE